MKDLKNKVKKYTIFGDEELSEKERKNLGNVDKALNVAAIGYGGYHGAMAGKKLSANNNLTGNPAKLVAMAGGTLGAIGGAGANKLANKTGELLQRKIESKREKKSAYEVVNDSFEKIAYSAIEYEKLTPEEKKEVNKNTRYSQQSLSYRRNNTKSMMKNSVAALAGIGLGSAVAVGVNKGYINAHGLKDSLKAKNIARKLNGKKVFSNMDELKNTKSLHDSYKLNAGLKRELGKTKARNNLGLAMITGSAPMIGSITGASLRDSHEVKKFMKERYGDNHHKSIRMNEKQRIIDKREEKSASDIVNDSFIKVAKEFI